jgi:putative membrane protein
MAFLFKILITGLSIFISAKMLKGVEVKSFGVALIAALVLLVLNMTLSPILHILSLPVTIITLGLFALIVNAIVILLVSKLVDGFEVESIFWALLFGIIQSVIASFLFWLF